MEASIGIRLDEFAKLVPMYKNASSDPDYRDLVTTNQLVQHSARDA